MTHFSLDNSFVANNLVKKNLLNGKQGNFQINKIFTLKITNKKLTDNLMFYWKHRKVKKKQHKTTLYRKMIEQNKCRDNSKPKNCAILTWLFWWCYTFYPLTIFRLLDIWFENWDNRLVLQHHGSVYNFLVQWNPK